VYDFNQQMLVLLPNEPEAETTEEVEAAMENNSVLSTLLDLKMNIVKFDTIIQDLHDLRYYRHLRKFSRDVEETLCSKALYYSLYAYFGVVGMTIGCLMIILVNLKLLTLLHAKQFFGIGSNYEEEMKEFKKEDESEDNKEEEKEDRKDHDEEDGDDEDDEDDEEDKD